MKEDYKTYLLYILIVLLVFLAFVVIYKSRLKKRPVKIKKTEPITGGTIGIFFDRENNVILIPYVKDKYGVGKATGELVSLNNPYKEEDLGRSVRKAMTLSKEGMPGKDSELMYKLNAKSWKEFSEGKRNISAYYNKDHGIVLNSTSRRLDGSYQINHFGIEKTAGEGINDSELGRLVMELLKRCR